MQTSVWKRIPIGGKSAPDLLLEMDSRSLRCDAQARTMMLDPQAFVPLPDPAEVALARVTVTQLGFPRGAGISSVCSRARQRGFVPCPLEVGPHLLMHLGGQRLSDRLWIPIGPVWTPASPEVRRLWTVDGRELSGCEVVYHAERWSPVAVFIFAVPDSSASAAGP